MSNGAAHERTPSRTEEIVVVSFTLLGFLGSVYLHKTGNPPIIVSIFLATGVASLVYRFLGGLHGATFVWGALKLGGAAAALLGIAVGVNHYLATQSLPVFPSEGIYGWQVGDQAWTGHVEVGKQGPDIFEMEQFHMCGTQWRNRVHMKQHGVAKVEWIGSNHMNLRVKIPFQYVEYDENCNRTGLSKEEVLEGDLTVVPAFAGWIHYHGEDESIGRMILVKKPSD